MPSRPNLVIEFHYKDGDVGVHEPTKTEADLWGVFASKPNASHIVIRVDNAAGQSLSNDLFAAARDFWTGRFARVGPEKRKP